MSYLMGIDIGSTNLKATIYDYSGNFIALGSTPNEVVFLDKEHPQWAFWDPDRIWSGIADAIKQAVSKISDPKLLKAVSVTGMGMDGVPIDKNGKWLYPFISWHCQRTGPLSNKWINEVGAERTFLVSGKQIFPFDTVFRLQWMKENKPEILEKTEKWLLIEDFVNFMLCGSKITDFSMATTTQLFDQTKREWSDEQLKIAGVDKKILPAVMPSGSKIGEITATASTLTGLYEGTPVILGGHDYHCAALAAGAFEPCVVMDITGTWEMVLCSFKKLNLSHNVFISGLSVESHVAKDMYAVAVSCVSGEMIEWFRRTYAGHDIKDADEKREWEALLKDMETVIPGSNGVMFLPHFTGSHCPEIDHNSLGAFIGMNQTVSPKDMLHAVIEGLNYQLKDMVMAIEKPMKRDIKKIIATGGATNNDYWMQNKADITGKAIEVPETVEATCLGAAMLAGIGTGIYKDERDAFKAINNKKIRTFFPDEKLNKKYEEYFSVYKKIYPALKKFIKTLINRLNL
jgi:sugar (pentulose or hexulose) kinase